jgi:hypothetical protein
MQEDGNVVDLLVDNAIQNVVVMKPLLQLLQHTN